MSKTLTVNGNVYEFPEQGTDPQWGEELSSWAEEVTGIINELVSIEDIPLTTFTLTNNQTTFADINGLSFNPESLRSARVTLDVYISSSDTELQESFAIMIGYKNIAEEFKMSISTQGDNSGVTLSVTENGQLQYKTTNVS